MNVLSFNYSKQFGDIEKTESGLLTRVVNSRGPIHTTKRPKKSTRTCFQALLSYLAISQQLCLKATYPLLSRCHKIRTKRVRKGLARW